MEAVLETRGLTKAYSGRTVVDSVSLTVRPGEVYGFLGPNGAGKTTVMKMALGLLPPTAGLVSLFGGAPGPDRAALRRIGMASETPYLYLEMTAAEYLSFFAGLYEVEDPARRVREILDRFGLSDVAGKRLRTFSQGMAQRANLARAFLHDPDLLFLDDPVAGLDPRWIKELRDIIVDSRRRGTTVFLSSHLLSIVEAVCDRVGIISGGRLIVEDTVEAVSGALVRAQVITVELAHASEEAAQAVRCLAHVEEVESRGAFLTVRSAGGVSREEIARAASSAGATVLMVQVEKTSLEDTFLELTEGNVAFLGKPQ